MTHWTLVRLSATVAGLAALSALAGCASSATEEQRAAALAAPTDTQQWESRVRVETAPDEILLAIHAEGLSQRQAEALDALVARWIEADGREIVVGVPAAGRDGRVSQAMVAAVRERLVDAGATSTTVRVASYDATNEKSPVLRVGYLRHAVVTPRCDQAWGDLTATRRNDAYASFGCAITANIAAQVANPQDLAGPRATTPADAERRDTVMAKYRKGEQTASNRDAQAVGTLSEVAK
ncbi:CpaD family pilus assembly protein [Caulobacter hibisci]|uniref:CpaD family pilus assembly lipoprotein n=1 Tax=Caulobacter hibisci TaxID=2035993 RepID=A0ABS0T2A1_9CAUL|nr:CpaD family pilus assembly lipoprotein [Caulobacter hibisci]MBI1686005.1 CpaD family pilus assembly lipoprotein [Caulobacter hibisci]